MGVEETLGISAQNANLSTLNYNDKKATDETSATNEAQTINETNATNEDSAKSAKINEEIYNYFLNNQETKLLQYDNMSVLKKIEQLYDIKTAYSLSAPFDEDITSTWEWVKGSTKMPYGIIAPDDVDENEELPVLIYMHGSDEGTSESLLKSRTYDDYVNQAGLEGFRGYIICPANSSGTWQGKASSLVEILDDFSQSHAIDMDKIAISGYSLGGCGLPSIVTSNEFNGGSEYKFCRAAIIAGFNSKQAGNDLGIETAVYVGEGDSDSINSMNKNLIKQISEENYHILKGYDHYQADKRAFTIDEDGNDRADMLEWLFENQD